MYTAEGLFEDDEMSIFNFFYGINLSNIEIKLDRKDGYGLLFLPTMLGLVSFVLFIRLNKLLTTSSKNTLVVSLRSYQ